MIVDCIIAPPNAPQVLPASPPQPSPPRLDRLDKTLIEAVREFGLSRIWSVLNSVADAEGPASRSGAAELRLRLAEKLQRLARLRLVHFAGRNWVSPEELDPEMLRAIKGRRGRTVRSPARHGS